MRIILSFGIAVMLSGCATSTIPALSKNGNTISAAQYDIMRQSANTKTNTVSGSASAELKEANDPLCQRLYENYNVSMKALAPKKKTLGSKIMGGVGSAASGLAVGAASYTGGIVAGHVVDKAISSATYDPNAGLNEMRKATSVIELQRLTMRSANESGCPLAPIMQ